MHRLNIARKKMLIQRMHLRLDNTDTSRPFRLSAWQSRETNGVYVLKADVGTSVELVPIDDLAEARNVLRMQKEVFYELFREHNFAVFDSLTAPARLRPMSDYLLKRITVKPEVMGGAPCIAGTRVTVGQIGGLVDQGYPLAKILEDYPYIVEDDVLAVIEYRRKHP